MFSCCFRPERAAHTTGCMSTATDVLGSAGIIGVLVVGDRTVSALPLLLPRTPRPKRSIFNRRESERERKKKKNTKLINRSTGMYYFFFQDKWFYVINRVFIVFRGHTTVPRRTRIYKYIQYAKNIYNYKYIYIYIYII